MRIDILRLFTAGVFFCLITTQALSQQEVLFQEAKESEPSREWVLGDVIEIDLEKNQLRLSYIDDKDGEDKQITIGKTRRNQQGSEK